MSAPRLSSTTLNRVPRDVARPSYDRAQGAGVVHLGTGAFHRAHQAVYFDALMQHGERDWMIMGSSLRSPDVAAQMNPQDGLYTLVERDGRHERLRMIGSVRGVMVASADPQALVRVLAQPSTALVTLTVTEKGYALDPATGALRFDDPGVAADLADPSRPRSAPGVLVAGLRARREAGLPPFTVLSCDNLPHNGQRTRDAVLALARRLDAGLADWIDGEGAFPSAMVDRIVPATTQADLVALEARLGVHDAAMVKTEPFSQWVVEDWFSDRRPPLETVGVQMTRDVAGWERAKLRLLNGAHSALAYLGALAGHEFVHEAVAAPGFPAFVDALWDEAGATLAPLAGFDARAYRVALAERFRNGALNHRLVQIAMDGSQKLPQRLLGSISDRRARGLDSPALTLAVAAWMAWQSGRDEAGGSFRVDDPLAATTAQALADSDGSPQGRVGALLKVRAVFPEGLASDAGFATALVEAMQSLMTRGSARSVADLPGLAMAGTGRAMNAET
jgi:fructuronate reductase